jgi:hypothetical protein
MGSTTYVQQYTAAELMEMSNQTKQMLEDIKRQVEESNSSIERGLIVRQAMRRAETHRDNLKKLCQRMIVEFDTNVAFITAILDEYIWFI